jgi:hypothetical protein
MRKYPHSFTGEIMKRLILAISLTLLGAQTQISAGSVALVDHDQYRKFRLAESHFAGF